MTFSSASFPWSLVSVTSKSSFSGITLVGTGSFALITSVFFSNCGSVSTLTFCSGSIVSACGSGSTVLSFEDSVDTVSNLFSSFTLKSDSFSVTVLCSDSLDFGCSFVSSELFSLVSF